MLLKRRKKEKDKSMEMLEVRGDLFLLVIYIPSTIAV